MNRKFWGFRAWGLGALMPILACLYPLAGSAQWTFGGAPDPYVRNVVTFGNLPVTGSTTMYVSTLGDGIYKGVDNGTNWTLTKSSNGLPTGRIFNVRATTASVLYAATDGYGVYKSTDSGANWASLNGTGSVLGCKTIRNLAIFAGSPNIIYAATDCNVNSGLWRSTDDGANWTRLGVGVIPPDTRVNSIQINGNGSIIFAATADNGLFRSTDVGATFAAVNTGFASATVNVLNVNFVDGVSTSVVAYVLPDGMYRSTDTGSTWTLSNAGLPLDKAALGGFSRAGGNTAPTTLYLPLDGQAIYRSTDSGQNWAVWGNTSGDQDTAVARAVQPDGLGRFYLPTLNGILRTDVNGSNFSFPFPWGQGSVSSITHDRLNPKVAYVTTGGNPVKILDVSTVPINDSVISPIHNGITGTTEDGVIVQDPKDPVTLYVTTNHKGVFKSTDGGSIWNAVNSGLPSTAGQSGRIVIDSNNSQTLLLGFTGGAGIYKSINGGASWNSSAVGLGTPLSKYVRNVRYAPESSVIVYAATDDGLYKSIDGAANWAKVFSAIDGDGSAVSVNNLRLNPNNAAEIYLVISQRNADGSTAAAAGVWKSANGGTNWTQVLSNKRATNIRVDGAGSVYAGLDEEIGQVPLLRSVDGGSTWQTFGVGLQGNRVRTFGMSAGDAKLLSVGTNNGVHSLDIVNPGLFRTYVSVSGNDANPCTLPAPCRLLPAALAAVKDGGEVWMLNSANFNGGTVSITKSVTILAVPGALGSIVGNGADAISVNAANARVTLRNLVILNLAGATNNGISIAQGTSLNVESCEIYGLYNGIVVSTGGALVNIKDTVIRDIANIGISLDNVVSANLTKVSLVNNVVGLTAYSGTRISISNSLVSGSSGSGIYLNPFNGSSARVTVSNSELSGNVTALAVNAQSVTEKAEVILNNVTIARNSTVGVSLTGGGTPTVYTAGNNTFTANAADITGGSLTLQAGQ